MKTNAAKTKASRSRKQARRSAKTGAKHQQAQKPARASGTRNKAAPQPSAAAAGPRQSKQAKVIALLRRAEGVTVSEIVSATGWQPHTVRGLFSGTLKKKLGLELNSASEEGRGRVYRITDTGEAGAAAGASA